jgi:DHA2 family multidrug resistance protein
MGLVTLWRTGATTDMDYWSISMPLMVMGLGLPFFFIPLTGLAMGSVDETEMANAAGLMNFLRTLSGAFATSLVTTVWDDDITRQHAELVGVADADHSVQTFLESTGMSPDAVLQNLDGLITGQSVMLATNQIFWLVGIAFLVAASVIWLAPKPARQVDPAAAGGH